MNKIYMYFILLSTVSSLTMAGCKKFLDVPSPNSKIPAQAVFQDEAMATAAISGVYAGLYSNTGFAGGGNQSVMTYAGLSADELKNNTGNPFYLQFQTNDIDPSSAFIQSCWSSMYKSIYEANAAIEGLETSSSLPILIKNQMKGEMLFVRGFCYFYLVNIFGNVPLALSTDYRVNTTLRRVPVTDVYDQIVSDLSNAESLLSEGYIRTDRIRPNKFAATALLSRVYLYKKDWERAEDRATRVLSNNNLYSLSDNFDEVFTSTSKEAIWQLKPDDRSYYTWEAYYFSEDIGPTFNVLNADLTSVFEADDKRKANWMKKISSNNSSIYLPFKYKQYAQTIPASEFSTVLRLAEIYLIRAEAKAQQNNISSAIDDINKIRQRAGISLIKQINPSISKDSLMIVIEKERQAELFAEWGHRWLDLKRWNLAGQRLKVSKPKFTDDDQLYPIPTSEINRNSNLKPQNAGY